MGARTGAFGPALRRIDTPAGLAVLFAAGLAVRLAIAPAVGFHVDLTLYQQWAHRLAQVGPRHFYAEGQFADYPPGYLYVLWVIGKLSATPSYLVLKLPAIASDLGLAWVSGVFAACLAPAELKERLPVRALVAAAVLFNPAVVLLSAGWGQVDSVPALFVLVALLLVFTRPPTFRTDLAALVSFAVAIAIKPQSGFVLPVIVYALYRRWFRHRRFDGLLRAGSAVVVATGVWAVSGLAFGLGPISLIRFYKDSASVYPVTSANAFNLWGVVGLWRPDSGHGAVSLAGIPANQLGILLFATGIALVVWWTHRAIEHGSPEALTLTIAAVAVAMLGYAVLTRMHERYMFMSLVILAPLAFLPRFRIAYAAVSALFVVNLWFAFAYFNSQAKTQGYDVAVFHIEPWFGWILGGYSVDSWQKKALSLTVTAIALALVWGVARLSWIPRTRRWRPIGEVPVDESSGPRWAPVGLVGLASGFSLVVLHGETLKAVNLNDAAFHLQMVRWASGQISAGRVPLDGWYPYLSLGSSHFHHYQSLSHTLTAYVSRLVHAGDQTTYLWFVYLLLALWPISVYAGARLLGWGAWPSAAAATLAPLVVSASGYGYEHGSYTYQGYGVYSQLWAMWTLPIAWGLTWRAVTRGRYYAAAAFTLALTMALHFITGYLAVLAILVWVVVPGRGVVRRAVRAGIVLLGSVLIAAWVLVPLIGDTKWTTQSEYYVGTFYNDSYGAHKVLAWLVTGQLFDFHRFPVISVLLLAGAVACLSEARNDVRARALLGIFALCTFLWFGRATLGGVVDLLPGAKDVQMHRFVMGVHLAGILIAGVGLGWLLRLAALLATRIARASPFAPAQRALASAAVGVAVTVGVLAPAWTSRASYDRNGVKIIRQQQAADTTDGADLDKLIAIVRARGDGRVYAGLRSNWGMQYKVGIVPVHAFLADRMVDTVGFTFRTIASLSTDPEAAFDETNPAQYQMFNARYILLPFDHRPPVAASLVASSGRHRLWEVKTSGYLQVVDRATAIDANRTDVEQAARAFMHSDLASRGIYPGVAFAGGASPAATFSGASPPPGPAGRVLTQTAMLPDGVFGGTVQANREAVVLLKASYDRRWTATVDGRSVRPVMMAPSLVGIEVPPGRHVVRFAYKPYDHYALLLTISALTLLGLAAYPRRESLARAWPERGPRRELPGTVMEESVRQ